MEVGRAQTPTGTLFPHTHVLFCTHTPVQPHPSPRRASTTRPLIDPPPRPQVLRLLLGAGADPCAPDGTGQTFIKEKCDVLRTISSRDSYSPHLSTAPRRQVLRLLLSKGAEPCAPDGTG